MSDGAERNFRRTWFVGLLLSLAAAAAFAGCLSPTLPLPPPAKPDVSIPDAAGYVHVEGSVNANARAFVENRRTGSIVGQDTDDSGEYGVELPAESGDQLEVWYSQGTDESPSIFVVVPDAGAAGNGGAGGSGL